MDAAQFAGDQMIAAFAMQTVHAMDALIRQPRCVRR